MTLPGEPPRRVMFPTTWPAIGSTATATPVRFERRFGYPGRVDPHERVWIVGEGLVGPAAILLQGEWLGSNVNERFAFEATSLLRERNHLEVRLDAGPDRVGLWDDIALEIRATAYLESVSREGHLLRGMVAGTCDRPLEVYALANGRTCGYSEVVAGEPFAIALEGDVGALRIELINVSTIWDVVEQSPV